ncbi:NAD(+)--rifampin ADP-ribosyltransferase [Pedobacter sp.]|uniref:NAD(+)--rifampin ADP-ribosyltransferase n=1 Tax=Pedobacter sp. TaxID=1411316 RepID=UPI003D7F5AE8
MEHATLYHGSKANLKNGDLITPGYSSNYGRRNRSAYRNFPTKSYRTKHPIKVIAEVKE